MGVKLHFQSTGTVLGQGAPVAMVGPALTIGRGAENDLCLPDPGKVISKNHCAIEEHGGRIHVVDLSTNGTFLNYGKDPVGPVATPLHDGDILTIGSYELMVELSAASQPQAVPEPLPEEPALPGGGLDDLIPAAADDGGDFLDELLGDDGAPVGPSGVTRPDLGDDGLLPPLGEEDDPLAPLPEPDVAAPARLDHGAAAHDAFRPQAPVAQTIPDDWEDDLGLPGAAPGPAWPAPQPALHVAPRVAVPPVLDPAPDPTPLPADRKQPSDQDGAVAEIEAGEAPKTVLPSALRPSEPPKPEPEPEPEPAPAGGETAARAFLDALGAADLDIADGDLERTMTELGQVMAMMVQGVREILMTRASIKSEFRIQQTVIAAGDNNPLKFSITTEQAIAALVRPTKGFLTAHEATEQALGDIKAHEVAMMTAMDAALKGILRQLSPEELEGQLTKGGGLSGLLQGKKARYWDVFESMYARISDQAENDFHELFSREFANAYQAQTERLR